MPLKALAGALALTALLATSSMAAPASPISADRMSATVREIASDAYEGRGPGTPAERKTVDYLVARLKAMGLEPAGEHGQWTQTVPLEHYHVASEPEVHVRGGGEDWRLRQRDEVMVQTLRPVDRTEIEAAPLVFVGYGVTAPERHWDDFKGQDLRGAIAVILINDPDFEARPGEPVAGQFGGQAETYYGRWIYKFEEAARRGALGALIIHETPGAGYGWSTVQASNASSYDIVREHPEHDRVLMQGWIQRDAASDLLRKAGLDLETLKTAARRADFHPVPLTGLTLSASYAVAHERVDSENVLAKRTGTTRRRETVMFGAHWDAFGLGPPDATGATARHGAADDATGVAGVLELARAFARRPRLPRTTVFALWTAEEQGLLGSGWYAAHPLQDPALMVANFTLDTLQSVGLSRDVVLVGAGQNELEDRLAAAAARQHRTVTPDAHPERGQFYRADHFPLARVGVPTLLLMSLGGGPDLVEGGRAAGDRWVADYTAHCYHQVCDVWRPDWNLAGAAQDVSLVFGIGRDLAAGGAWPAWKDGSEFRAIREQTRDQRR